MLMRPRPLFRRTGSSGFTAWLPVMAMGLALAGCTVAPGPGPGDELPDCFTDADCADTEICTGGACVPMEEPPCSGDDECADGQACVDGACVTPGTGCTADADCAAGEVCTDGSCVPGAQPECTNDSDCAADEVCTGGACVPAPPECDADADCKAGEVCTAGACVEAPKPAVTGEIGYTDPQGVYHPVADGEDFPLFTMGQGGSHVYVTTRLTGFPPPREGVVGVDLRQQLEVPDLMETLNDTEATLPFTPLDDSTIEFPRRVVLMQLRPFEIDGKQAVITFTMKAFDDPSISVVVQRTVRLKLSEE